MTETGREVCQKAKVDVMEIGISTNIEWAGNRHLRGASQVPYCKYEKGQHKRDENLHFTSKFTQQSLIP